MRGHNRGIRENQIMGVERSFHFFYELSVRSSNGDLDRAKNHTVLPETFEKLPSGQVGCPFTARAMAG